MANDEWRNAGEGPAPLRPFLSSSGGARTAGFRLVECRLLEGWALTPNPSPAGRGAYRFRDCGGLVFRLGLTDFGRVRRSLITREVVFAIQTPLRG